MDAVNSLQNIQLPDDLKKLMVQLEVPEKDPKIQLFLWLWKQMTDSKAVLDTARVSTAAVFDSRLERMNRTAELLLSIDESLHTVLQQLQNKPFGIKEQVERELTEPIKAAPSTCEELNVQLKSLLGRFEQGVKQSQNVFD